MRLFDATASPNCRKVRVAARELGIRLELVAVDLAIAIVVHSGNEGKGVPAHSRGA